MCILRVDLGIVHKTVLGRWLQCDIFYKKKSTLISKKSCFSLFSVSLYVNYDSAHIKHA